MINEQAMAEALMDRMRECFPIPVRATLPVVQAAAGDEIELRLGAQLEVTSVLYTGDMGGICCAIQISGAEKTLFVVSLTNLEIEHGHPLRKAIKAYQKKRRKQLAMEGAWSFS